MSETPAPCVKHPKPFWPWDRVRKSYYYDPLAKGPNGRWSFGWCCPICEAEGMRQREESEREYKRRSALNDWARRNIHLEDR